MGKAKCVYCNQPLDTSKEEWERPKGNRYAHKYCCTMDNEEYVKDCVRNLAKSHLKDSYRPQRVSAQLNRYINKEQMTPIQIYNALKYWYEVLKNTPEEANGGIGIVPYIYEEAEQYFQEKEKRHQAIAETVVKEEETPLVIEVQHTPPQRPHQYRIIDLK